MYNLSTYRDEQLLRLLREDDEKAFAELFDRYWKTMYSSAFHVLQSKTSAEDVVQEVFISLWRRRHEVQIVSLKSYLYQATRFQVFKAIRAEKAGRDFFDRLASASRQIMAEDPMLLKELTGMYEKVLATLPADVQEIFRLQREGGLTYQQIAEQKGISVKTVEKKMSQALQLLRTGLDKALLIALINELLK